MCVFARACLCVCMSVFGVCYGLLYAELSSREVKKNNVVCECDKTDPFILLKARESNFLAEARRGEGLCYEVWCGVLGAGSKEEDGWP